MNFEDHFSQQAQEYAQYRPSYLDDLYAYLASIAPRRRLAWDCGTGSGQAALGLAKHFERVIATDASPDQIATAFPHERVAYLVETAEHVNLDTGSVDDRYQTIPFPFEELQPPRFEIESEWDMNQLSGFLDSWSATQRYKDERGDHPLKVIWHELREAWGEPQRSRPVQWPLHLRVGKVW